MKAPGPTAGKRVATQELLYLNDQILEYKTRYGTVPESLGALTNSTRYLNGVAESAKLDLISRLEYPCNDGSIVRGLRPVARLRVDELTFMLLLENGEVVEDRNASLRRSEKKN